MPIRTDPWPDGTPCWVDLAVPDVEAAREFYTAVLGWEFQDTGEDFGGYVLCLQDGRAAAGIGPVQGEGQPSAWTTYLASADADAAAASISEHGGRVLQAPFEVAGQGRMLIAADPQGAVFGVWQAGGHNGVEIYNEPGGLVWNEASVADPDAARDFYAGVFGFRFEPVEGAEDYTTFHRAAGAGGGGDTADAGDDRNAEDAAGSADGGEDVLGGIGGLGDVAGQAQPNWLAYFAVADADACVAAATERGATVAGGGAETTPYGRMAIITDPQDATFAVMGTMVAD